MRKIFIAFVLIVTCIELISQTNDGSLNFNDQGKPQGHEKYRWFSAGVGAYGAHGSSGFGLGFSYDMKGRHHLKLRLTTVGEFTLMSGNEPDAFTEGGVLYSRVFGKEWFRVTASGGFGFLAGRKTLEIDNVYPYNYREEKIFTPAVPLELGMDFAGKRFGVGLAGFSNINPDKSISGILVRILFGKIR